MDLFDIVKSCLRRWYVVLPILLITSWLAYGAYTSVRPVYYANTAVTIAPANSYIQFAGEGKPSPRNGLLEAGGATFITNLAVLGFDDTVRARVVAAGGQPNFTVRMFPVAAGGQSTVQTQVQLPLILIEDTESDPRSATKTVELASQEVQPILDQLQRAAGVPEDQMVKAIPAAAPTAVMGTPSRGRKVISTVFAGGCIAIVSGVVADVLILRRRRRRTSETVVVDDRQHSLASETEEASVSGVKSEVASQRQ